MIAIHIVAVVLMSMFERENLVRAMVTGNKPAARHPGASDARSPAAVAWAIGAIVVGVTSYLIVQYDPDAFVKRSAESFESRANAGGAAAKFENEQSDDD